MSMRIIFTASASTDLKNIYSRSQELYPLSAAKFRADFREALTRIAEAPLRWTIWQPPNYRRWLLNPYPYMIIYHADDHGIVIEAVRHQRQKPEILLPRP